MPVGGDKIRGRDSGEESSIGGGIFPVAPLAGKDMVTIVCDEEEPVVGQIPSMNT